MAKSLLRLASNLIFGVKSSNISSASPKPSKMPAGANPAANEIWKNLLTKYKDRIYANKDPSRQWASAVFIYVKSCAKREIEPYTKGVERAKRVRRALRILARKVSELKSWSGGEFHPDFHEPYITATGTKGRELTIKVLLREAPCVRATVTNARGESKRKSAGRNVVDKVDLEEEFNKILNWLEAS
jgi:hypothetical protein